MDSIIPWVIGSLLVVTAPFISSKITINNPDSEAQAGLVSTDSKKATEYKIKTGDTLTDILGSFKISYEDAQEIINSSKEVFDFTKIQTGKVLKFVFVKEALASIEYPISSDEILVVQKNKNSFITTTKPIIYDTQIVTKKGVITDSLFLTASELDIPDKAIMELADIFSSDIDFATDIQEGDSFTIVYEKRSLDGKDAGAGNVLAARFMNNDKTYTAFRFDDKFYNENGESMARQFLKSPLNYAQISSGYSYSRTNPVTKQVTPHRAIDYAASAGTPVIATADGKVTLAGSKGGLGIAVEIKHGNYLTQYAHLSSVAKGIKTGVFVTRGQIIGYVGSTGISTGPHLQYAMFNNGNPINPLTADFSRGESIKTDEKESFSETKNKLQDSLD
ncbi:MAG: hypothetical protein RJA61_250 [Candidatus Parcubacteria bacterium]|jgi:murein DD-endopeptidase MepM/ murein hydrolase activator NlpD